MWKRVYVGGLSEYKIHRFYQIVRGFFDQDVQMYVKEQIFQIGMYKCTKGKKLEKNSKENETID